MDDYYIIKKKTLTDIADSVRRKKGVTTNFFPENIPSQIDSIQTNTSDATGIPSYVVTEGKRVASGMISKRGANSLTFIAMSDMHEMGDTDHTDATVIEKFRRANRNAGQGAKVVADNINIDFFASLGDMARGSRTSTITDFVQSIVNARTYIYDVTKDVESFITLGNHDTGTYGFAQNGEYLSQGVCDGLFGTYRYVDFTAKKVRVICLNTAEVEGLVVSGDSGTERMTGTQLQWFANSLDLSNKSDAAEWGIVILSHHPLDWYNIAPANNCLKAYLNGTTYSATHEGVAVSKAFSGKNDTKIIANIHGHTHCFNVSDLSGTTVKRIAIPNACFDRTNEYGEEGNLTYGDATSYEKTDGTAKNTAFCLVSIDLDNEVIYADCYGAGIDRVISYGGEEIETFTVTNNLSNATNSNGTASVVGGASYSGSIVPKYGYELNTVTVTMDGVDITSTAYSNGVISIGKVTGNIVITATTTKIEVPVNYTNLVPLSTELVAGSTAIYNGIGYKDGAYASSSGTTVIDGTDPTATVTGLMPYVCVDKVPPTIYIKGVNFDTSLSRTRVFLIRDGNYLVYGFNSTRILEHYTVEQLGTNYFKLTPIVDSFINHDFTHMRISAVGTGENLIVTVNEEIESGTGGGDTGGDTTSYTNLVPTSKDSSGAIYNGKGYKENYRLNSSGEEAELTNAVVSGFIPYNQEIIEVWGSTASTAATSGNYVGFYDASYNKVHVTAGNHDGVTYEALNGKYLMKIDKSKLAESHQSLIAQAKYIRCSFGQCLDPTVFTVTLDEEIIF